MKKSIQILGLPIISIADGQQIGSVKSLVINPDKGSIDFLTIEHDDWQVSVKAIPFKKVVGIGEYAVTVENESAIIDLNEIPIANQLVNKKIKINGTKVMTRKGELIGEVTEYYVDEENGHILGTMLKLPNKEVALPSTSVLTYGKDIIIVKEDAPDFFLNSIDELGQADQELQEISPVSNNRIVEIDHTAENSEMQSIKKKQIELLSGKTATKDIFDKNGNTLISNGTVLSEDDIIKAQEEGPSVFVELSMNVE